MTLRAKFVSNVPAFPGTHEEMPSIKIFCAHNKSNFLELPNNEQDKIFICYTLLCCVVLCCLVQPYDESLYGFLTFVQLRDTKSTQGSSIPSRVLSINFPKGSIKVRGSFTPVEFLYRRCSWRSKCE